MNYLLDTCLISELVAKQPNQQVLDWLDAQLPETLYLSVITIGEIAKGISKITASIKHFIINCLLHTPHLPHPHLIYI
ncbi:MAG: PIN domain-containing protein [Nostoc sp. ChiSLP01]|nr:hypothetical protein [Nostoc sp. CmiSLP01]MDZ8288977.1 hypothetical protein [Nostoc sp. ChiSLP01]